MLESPCGVTSEAGHGDAQSDIVGGALITVIVLFVLMAIFAALLVLILRTKTQEAHAQAAELRELEQALALSPEERVALLEQGNFKSAMEEAQRKQREAEQSAQQAKAEAEEKVTQAMKVVAEANGKAALAETRAAQAEKEAAQAKAAAAKAQAAAAAAAKANPSKPSKGKLIASNLRLWVFKDGYVDITDSKAKDGFWNIRYKCRVASGKVPVGKTGDPTPESFELGR